MSPDEWDSARRSSLWRDLYRLLREALLIEDGPATTVWPDQPEGEGT